MIRILGAAIMTAGFQSRREAEKAAVENIITSTFGNSATLSHAADGHPTLIVDGRDLTISISHCADEAVVAVSDEDSPIGIDIETAREQLRRVAARFLTDAESDRCRSLHDLLRAWTAKEAVYKAALTPGLALREIHIDSDGHAATARGIRFSLERIADTPDKVITLAIRR